MPKAKAKPLDQAARDKTTIRVLKGQLIYAREDCASLRRRYFKLKAENQHLAGINAQLERILIAIGGKSE